MIAEIESMKNNCLCILAINPGSTSTKIGVFCADQVIFSETIEHTDAKLSSYSHVFDQYEYRLQLILEALHSAGIDLQDLDAVVGRGGLLKPLTGGTYLVNELMLRDLQQAERGEHASNLGGIIASAIADQIGVPAFIVDPVSVDELEPVARVTGHPELMRVSMSHALNTKAVAHSYASSLGKKYEELRLIVAHLGSGISVSAHLCGKMIDVNDSKQEGAFAPDRCGTLPTQSLVKMCFSGKYSEKEILAVLFGKGGIYAHLGTKDMREVESSATAGDSKATLLLAAMPYQIAKDIGARATVLSGKVDAIILTGGIAYSKLIVDRIIERVEFIAPVVVMPGEEELPALVAGATRVLKGEERARIYA